MKEEHAWNVEKLIMAVPTNSFAVRLAKTGSTTRKHRISETQS